MKPTCRTLAVLSGFALFIVLPLMIYALEGFPRRSLLKETLSVLAFLSLSIMIGQFFLARSNALLRHLFRPAAVQKVHKYLAYGAVSVMLLHPALIVLPRYFEGGVKPFDAFWTMVTTLDNLGIVLGLIAWGLLAAIGVTVFFRVRLFKRFKTRYRGWRSFHAALAVAFTALGTWHAILLGRHVDLAMTIFLLSLVAIGSGLLARLYWPQGTRPFQTPANAEGAKA